jgi:hypothetical protein
MMLVLVLVLCGGMTRRLVTRPAKFCECEGAGPTLTLMLCDDETRMSRVPNLRNHLTFSDGVSCVCVCERERERERGRGVGPDVV